MKSQKEIEEQDFIREAHTFIPVDLEGRDVFMERLEQALKKAHKMGVEGKREILAELEHDQWVEWSQAIFASENISEERHKRWSKLWVPYGELTEEEKDQDRKYADRVIEVLKEK